VLQPIVENGQITGIVVADPGTGYSTGSNGTTTGPNGAIFSNPGDTIVNTPYPGPIIPGGTNLEQPYTVPAGTTIPTGTVISSGTQLVTDTIVDGNTLPSGTILSNNLIVPFGTTIPTGSIISNLNATPYDIQVPSVLDLPQQIIDDLPDPGFSNSLEPGDGTGLLVAGYNSYPDGTLVFVTPGTQISLPLGTTAELTDKNGNVLQVLVGKGPNSPITVKVAGFFTTPKTDLNTITVDNPTDNFGRYPVALSIKDIIIANRGINYQPGDEIVIQPNFGAKLKPRFDSFGRLMDVEVLDEGIGFTEIPNAYIKSTTGINAKMRVLFRVHRIGEDIAEGTVVPEGTPIIRVVDCVGQVT
jgi:hypothetical protein